MYMKKKDQADIEKQIERMQNEGISPSEFMSQKFIEWPGSTPNEKTEGAPTDLFYNYHRTRIGGLSPIQAYSNKEITVEQLADVYAMWFDLEEEIQHIPDNIRHLVYTRRRILGFKRDKTRYKVIPNKGIV